MLFAIDDTCWVWILVWKMRKVIDFEEEMFGITLKVVRVRMNWAEMFE